MEHRWGKRVPTDLKVRLEWRPDGLAIGRLRDFSLSGAYVEGVPPLPQWTEFPRTFPASAWREAR